MSKVIAVTRNGLGDFWLFESFVAADRHPIIQFGDVICTSPDQLFTQYSRLELSDLYRRLGDEGVRSEFLRTMTGPHGVSGAIARYKQWTWDRMVEIGKEPPTDSDEIVSIIRQDRVLTLAAKERKMSDDKTQAAEEKAAKAPKAPKEPKEPKEPVIKTIAGFPLDHKITLLVDASGNPYGPDNNPKRPGSATHQKFANYRNGITVGEAAAAGLTAADIKYDVEKNFISVSAE